MGLLSGVLKCNIYVHYILLEIVIVGSIVTKCFILAASIAFGKEFSDDFEKPYRRLVDTRKHPWSK